MKDKLFKDINTGKFAERTFPLAKVNDAPEYRLVEGLSAQEVYEFTNAGGVNGSLDGTPCVLGNDALNNLTV